MSERKYFSMRGEEKSLTALCRVEPEWAAYRITELEAEVERLQADNIELKCQLVKAHRKIKALTDRERPCG